MAIKLSNTTQRKVIIEELKKLRTHPTADELYEIVKVRLPKISLGTVYRNLEQLSNAGKILKLGISGKQKRFDGNVEKHFHLRCNTCGAVRDIDHELFFDIDHLIESNRDAMGISGYNIEFCGKCQDCK